jgi:hypothetical protein
MTIMVEIKRKELTLVEASQVMDLSYRQTRRVWRRYQTDGDAGLVHRLRGQPSLRRKAPELRQRVLARYDERYWDFGPTLAAEYLEADGLKVDHETLRRWLITAGKRSVRRRRQRHRQWREQQSLLWPDGPTGRVAPRLVRGLAGPVRAEGDGGRRDRAAVGAVLRGRDRPRASYDVFAGWVAPQGVPRRLYVDRDSICRCEGLGSVTEQLAGQAPQTQFGRAMETLDVELILAHSLQAKGRVERMNGVLQDRLVKALRLAGINDLEGANRFLAETFLPVFNRKFNVMAASTADVHRGVPRELDEALSWEAARVVQRDWTVASGGRWYQLDRQHEALSLAGKKVIVRTLRDGRVQLVHRGKPLKWRELPGRPQRVRPARPRVAGVNPLPAANHPWRRLEVGVGREYWRAVKAHGRAIRAAARLVVRDSGRPPIRSGLPPSRTASRGNKATNNNQRRGHF